MGEKTKTYWIDLLNNYTNSKDVIDKLWIEIENTYSEKGRYYHNLDHIRYMISKVLKHVGLLEDADIVLFSVFYHDIIYNPKKSDNEEKSAELACERLSQLGLSDDRIERCFRQIMATKKHNTSNDQDTNYLLDFDLMILGEDWDSYFDYTQKIRKEYAMYPDFLYKPGRKKVLCHFLEMDHIFKTEQIRASHEIQARENIRRELNAL